MCVIACRPSRIHESGISLGVACKRLSYSTISGNVKVVFVHCSICDVSVEILSVNVLNFSPFRLKHHW